MGGRGGVGGGVVGVVGVADGGGVAVADGVAGVVGRKGQDISGKVAGDEGLEREQEGVPCSVLVSERW